LLDGNNTLYLVAPLGGERRVGQVFSVMMQDLIAEAFERGNRNGPVDPSLLVVLDEAANTALPTLPEWAATVTGVGIQLVTVWQSKGQIDRVYGKDADSLLTNHRTKLLYPSGISDLATLDYFEKLIGNEHIRSDLDNPRGISGSADRNRAHTPSTAVPFLTPAILRQMRVGDALLIHGALPPAWIKAGGVSRRRNSPQRLSRDGRI
jgi:type IV secretion system protein VirD4